MDTSFPKAPKYKIKCIDIKLKIMKSASLSLDVESIQQVYMFYPPMQYSAEDSQINLTDKLIYFRPSFPSLSISEYPVFN